MRCAFSVCPARCGGGDDRQGGAGCQDERHGERARWRPVRGNSVPAPRRGRGTAGRGAEWQATKHSKRGGVAEKQGGLSQDRVGILHPHPLHTFPGTLCGTAGIAHGVVMPAARGGRGTHRGGRTPRGDGHEMHDGDGISGAWEQSRGVGKRRAGLLDSPAHFL